MAHFIDSKLLGNCNLVVDNTAVHCPSMDRRHLTAVHYTAPHCTVLHYTTLHCTALHYTALYCKALQ